MEIIGWIGTVLVIIAYYPQIHHLYVEKCAWGISITTWVIWLAASGFLLAYALLGRRTLFAAVQMVNLLAIAITIVLARKNRKVCPYHSAEALASSM